MGASTAAVRYGGDQDAKDGGFDVVVTLPVGCRLVPGGYIPKRITAFQCKKPGLAAAGIRKEMRPNGKLRPSIAALPDKSSAYVIVCSGSSTTKSALDARLAAMKKAAGTHSRFRTLDFYDRNHIATWVRDFPGAIVWLREKSGAPLRGWRPYGGWAASVDEEYIPDSDLRIHLKDRAFDPVDGVTELRKLLVKPGSVLRFVGHSGVGKTRLLQALFDERVGANSLDPMSAIYTDMELAPDPTPASLLGQLIGESRRAILVVDNCDSQTHRKLTEICSAGRSAVSLITVEYEIREDQPEGTEVVHIDNASNQLIERLLNVRYPKLGQSNAASIAKFAGGNSRLALAIASTVRKGQSVAQLRDAQFFHRLFHQRNEDQSLLQAARVFSLVFSFDGKNADQFSELAHLSALSGISTTDLFRHLTALKKKRVVQARGVWRAILPEAIGNFLAYEVLDDYPMERIEETFRRGPERLLTSFSRRLGYLHKSERAVEIAREWLREGGWLSDVGELANFRQTIFRNITPTAPEDALAAIERALAGASDDETLRRMSWCLDWLALVAFDRNLFARSVLAMASLLKPTNEVGRSRNTDDFQSLFYVRYSGTEAGIEQRLLVVRDLIRSKCPRRQGLALLALKGALSTYFQPPVRSDFGTRLRGVGYWPAGSEQISEWFSAAIAFTADLADTGDSLMRDRAKEILADHLPGLWHLYFVTSNLEVACLRIAAKECYWQGWLAVRRALNREDHHAAEDDPASHIRLLRLEENLRPKSIIEEALAVLASQEWSRVSLSLDSSWSEIDPNSEQVEHQAVEQAHKIGKALAKDRLALSRLSSTLFAPTRAPHRLHAFGRGLALGSSQRRRLWTFLRTSFLHVGEDQRQVEVLRGFLDCLNDCDPALRRRILDESAASLELQQYIPSLQCGVLHGSRDVARLIGCLERSSVETWRFRALWGAAQQFTPTDLRCFVLALAARADGLALAVEILGSYLKSSGPPPSGDCELRSAGMHLLSRWKFEERDDFFDREMATIIRHCLDGEGGIDIAFDIWRRARQSEAAFAIAIQCDDTLAALMMVQPMASLDGLLAGAAEDVRLGAHFLPLFQGRTNPLDVVPIHLLLDWCDASPSIRYPLIAQGITVTHSPNKPDVKWSSVALAMLGRVVEPEKLLRGFLNRIMSPMEWLSSHARAMENNSRLLDALERHSRKELRDYLPEARVLMMECIDQARRQETLRSGGEGSFE